MMNLRGLGKAVGEFMLPLTRSWWFYITNERPRVCEEREYL